MESYMKCLIYLCLLFEAATVKGQILDVTAFNNQPLISNETGYTFFGGYKSSTDVDATISLGRAVDTGTGPDWPPFPRESILEPYVFDGRVHRIILPPAIGLPRIGAFYVDAGKGNVFHRMIIITMSRNAGVLPESQTLTTAVGQSVTLSMILLEPTQFSMLEWRFNGTIKPMWTSNSSVVIPSVSKEDEGIYECYYVGHRKQGRQGIMRLIVQECDPGWWNPPSCDQECTACYNGGVCDLNSGHCVCPPGFGGTNCEIVFGSNSWGNDGVFTCTRRQDRHGDACRGRLFCRPDPYGCSCIAGYKGIDCSTECNQGTFGAGCTQECHCDGMNCLIDTGECKPGVQCMSGWSGVNCQGPGAPNSVTTPSADFQSIMVRWHPPDPLQGTWASPLTYYIIYWQTLQGRNTSQSITWTDLNREPPYTYKIMALEPGTEYSIVIQAEKATGKGPVSDPPVTQVTEEGLPSASPINITPTNIQQRQLQFQWEQPARGSRRGTITHYSYRLKDLNSGQVSMDILGHSTTGVTQVEILELEPFREYEFQVRAYTSIGPGPYSEPLKVQTAEAVPSTPLDISIPSVDFQSFTVEWSPPRNPFGVISGYDIRYWQTANRNPTTVVSPAVEENPASLNFPRYHQIANLQRMVEYSIQVRAKTTVGPGPWNEPPVTVVTEEGAPGRPDMLSYETGETKVTLSWNRPRNPNGTIVLYYVEFRAIEKPYESNFKALTRYKQNVEYSNPSYKRHFNYIVDNLEPSTRYEFLVAARSNVGRGKPSSVRLFTTGASSMPSPPPISAAGSTSLTITMSFTSLSFKYFVSYVIGVERKQRLSKRQNPDFNDTNTYITAKISKFDFNGTFTVGDGKVYGNYENRALESNRNYDIYLGVTSGQGKNELVKWGAEPLSATAASMSSASSSSTAIWAAVGVIIIAVVIVVILVAVFLKMKQKKNPRTPPQEDIEIRDIVTKSDETSDDDPGENEYEDADLNDQEYEEVTVSKWNIPWKDLNLSGKILGKGSFGEVQFGRVFVKDKWVKAAVKTLKEGTPESERVLFKEEFDTMTKIGYHPNVVNVLGLCDHGGTLYVVLEYVPHGNLRKFLRKCRKESTERVTETGKKGEENSNLTSDQLLNFTIGVAKAMKHVTSCGVIHRDLAARNVLVGKDMKPKVADFGMSRGEDVYVQTSTQRVPTRWLAIESLTRKTYSAQTDVWSFGILLWEIATFGGTPYPDLETKHIAYKLTDGYRMPKPDNCGDDMYDLMLMCWKEVPEERPTFHDIVAILTNMTCKEEIYMSTVKYENFKYAAINPDKDDN